MVFRIEAAIALGLIAAPAAAQVRIDARHDHWRKHCAGTLEVHEDGVRFSGAKDHQWRWKWIDIQQAKLSSSELTVTTYLDVMWRAGADREYRFALPKDASPDAIEARLRAGLGPHYIAAWNPPAEARWSRAAKHLERFGGKLGVLIASESGLAFRADKPVGSRTWNWTDIERVSSAGPYELTLTTYERSRAHYGGRRDFTFQLREPLDAQRYQELWNRIERTQHATVLDAFAK
jgi:hypothetical protein